MNERQTSPDQEHNIEKGAVQIDAFGVKLPYTPADRDEDRPQTWKEVGRRLNKLFMRIVIGPVNLLATAFESASTFLKGVGAVPDSLANRIEGAHSASDKAEGKRQLSVEENLALLEMSPFGSAADQERAIRNLQQFLQEIQESGFHVEIRDLGDGRAEFVVVRLEVSDEISEITGPKLIELDDLPVAEEENPDENESVKPK